MIPLLVFSIFGCGAAQEVVWLEGAGYTWNGFNHRVSHVQYTLEDSGATVSIVGGTSTTGVVPSLPAECQTGCGEIPAPDKSDVHIRWGRVESRKIRTGRSTVSVVVGPDGGEATGKVTLNKRAKGDVTAFITGFTLSSDEPLTGGEACYTPSFGWPVRLLDLEVEAGKADGKDVSVTVRGAFHAGSTFEDLRECLDDVAEEAVFLLDVDVMVVATKNKISDFDVGPFAEEYGWAGEGVFEQPKQPDPTAAERPLDGDGKAMYGWTRLHWTFHEKEGIGRGAYLRTLTFDIDPDAGLASGHATNISPVTQQSEFDYTFEGSAVSIAFDDDITRGVIIAEALDVADSDGVIAVHELAFD